MTFRPILTATALALALSGPMPVAAAGNVWAHLGLQTLSGDSPSDLVEVRQGRSGTGLRGRDRERDDDRGRRNDDRGGDDSGSGRSRPRVPGGSGCDSPRDILEHPECLLPGTTGTTGTGDGSGSGRDRPRIPGGSGCDSPRDMIEHPECRL